MRRIILSLLLVLTSVFVISCSDSGSDSGSSSTFTPITKDNPDTWVGTYDLYYLHPDGGDIMISNNCQRYNATDVNCYNVAATGQLVISKDETGKYRVETKIQLSQNAPLNTGDYLEQTYTYVDYGAIAPTYSQAKIYDDNGTAITDEKWNPVLETQVVFDLSHVTVTGRTLTKEFVSSVSHPRISYRSSDSLNLFQPYHGNLRFTRIMFYKKSDTPITLDPNTPFTPMSGFKEVPDKADPVVQ